MGVVGAGVGAAVGAAVGAEEFRFSRSSGGDPPPGVGANVGEGVATRVMSVQNTNQSKP